jgi:hypothetical protein
LIIFLIGLACILITSRLGFYFGDREATRLEPTATPTSWKSIPLPGGVQPDHFIDSLTPYAHVAATNGKIYNNPCFTDRETWTEGEIKNGLGGSCDSHPIIGFWRADFPDPPRPKLAESYCLLTGDYFPAPTNLGHACLYVILDNGELMRWDTTAWSGSEERPTPIPVKSVTYTETVNAFTVCGGIIGLLAVILFSIVARHLKRA